MLCPSQKTGRPALPRGAAFLGVMLLAHAALTALAPPAARADEFPRVYESARGVAMGDSLTSLAEGLEAMFYNPAGIVQVDGWLVRASTWEEESREDGQLSGKDFFDALDKLGGKDPVIAEGFLASVADRPQSVRTQSLAGFHTKGGFGLAFVDTIRKQTRAAESVPSPSLNVSYDHISGVLMNLGFASEVRLLMWGVTLKYLTREAAVRNVPPTVLTVESFDPEYGEQGDPEFDVDVGILGRLPFPLLRPTVGIAIFNLRAPDYGLVDVPPLRREINVGLSLQPDFLPDWMRLLVSFDRRDYNHTAIDDPNSRRRDGWGMELSFLPQTPFIHLLNIRAGNNQGQSSFGIGANLAQFVSVEFVQYSEELGEGSHRDPQRRRMLQIKLGF